MKDSMTTIDRVTDVLYSVPPRQRIGMRWRLAPDVFDALRAEVGWPYDVRADRLLGYPLSVDKALAPGAIEWESDAVVMPAPEGYSGPPCLGCGSAWDAAHADGCPVVAEPEDDSLDAAWDAAEAALPEGWEHLAVQLERNFGTERWRYVAKAGPFDDLVDDDGWSGPHPTPAAALRALTEKLREKA